MTNPLYIAYHDENGDRLHDDQALLSLLCMETYQAGLSWETVHNGRLSESLFMAITFKVSRR